MHTLLRQARRFFNNYHETDEVTLDRADYDAKVTAMKGQDLG